MNLGPDDQIWTVSTADLLGLEPGIVEKDWYVTQTIAAVSGFRAPGLRLVFAGGTSLSKAHQIVQRMSEDVDFKMVLQDPEQTLSRNARRKQLNELSHALNDDLVKRGFVVPDVVSRNEGSYVRMDIQYPQTFELPSALRSHVKLELTLAQIREQTCVKPIQSFIGAARKLPADCTVECVDLTETAAEKWVSLLRRTARTHGLPPGSPEDDPALVRHLYDVHCMDKAGVIDLKPFLLLCKEIVQQDATQFQAQDPEFAARPQETLRQAWTTIQSDPLYAKRYEDFVAQMVWQTGTRPGFEEVVSTWDFLTRKALLAMGPVEG